MKTAGFILIVLGLISLIGAIIAAANGQPSYFGGLTFIVLGVFLLSRAEKRKEEELKKKHWIEGSTKKDQV